MNSLGMFIRVFDCPHCKEKKVLQIYSHKEPETTVNLVASCPKCRRSFYVSVGGKNEDSA